jgi:site-specific recombinase XerC
MQTKPTIHDVADRILADLYAQHYSDYTVGRYRHCYHALLRYAEAQGLTHYSESVGLDFLESKYGLKIEGFFGKHPAEMRSAMRSLQVLWDYTEYGKMVIHRRPDRKPFECPASFFTEYQAFQEVCRVRAYTPMGKSTLFNILERFLLFLDGRGIATSEQIHAADLTQFVSYYSGCRSRYIATILSTLRNYLTFLYSERFLSVNLSESLPKVRTMRHAFIPSSWQHDDVLRLLAAVDRQNPKGKRDYAILLLVVRLGLRVSDIRTMTLENLHWSRKIVSIIMTKTKRPLELPLLDDVGDGPSSTI